MDLSEFTRVPVVLSFSGGKDSVASWLYLRECGFPLTCAFCDTGHEARATLDYIDMLRREHGLPLVRLQPIVRDIWQNDPPKRIPRETWDDPLDMDRLIRIKRRSPSGLARFCTSILKMKPLRRYIETQPPNVMIASGLRAQEGTKRAALEPYAYDDFMRRNRILPIHEWTHEEVFAIHAKYGVPPNPLYLQGCSRVGCWPCIFARKAEIAAFARDAEAVERVRRMERPRDDGRYCTWFSPDMVPKAYRSLVDFISGQPICTIDDVIRWATCQQPQFKRDGLFADQDVPLEVGEDLEAETCSSVYHLCE